MAPSSLKLSLFSFLAIALPASLLPSLHQTSSSLFLILPPLWHSILSCFTPPCLFLLLNLIILVLTLSSGILHKSNSSSPDLYSEFPVRTACRPKQHWILQSPIKRWPLKMQPNGLSREPSVKEQFTEKMPEEGDELIEEDLQLARDDGAFHSKPSDLDLVVSSGIYRRNKSSAAETVSEECRAIRRSQSVDCAALLVSEGSDCTQRQSSPAGKIVLEVPPQDDLSGEALKNKIDKFISDIYAQIRSEDF